MGLFRASTTGGGRGVVCEGAGGCDVAQARAQKIKINKKTPPRKKKKKKKKKRKNNKSQSYTSLNSLVFSLHLPSLSSLVPAIDKFFSAGLQNTYVSAFDCVFLAPQHPAQPSLACPLNDGSTRPPSSSSSRSWAEALSASCTAASTSMSTQHCLSIS